MYKIPVSILYYEILCWLADVIHNKSITERLMGTLKSKTIVSITRTQKILPVDDGFQSRLSSFL